LAGGVGLSAGEGVVGGEMGEGLLLGPEFLIKVGEAVLQLANSAVAVALLSFELSALIFAGLASRQVMGFQLNETALKTLVTVLYLLHSCLEAFLRRSEVLLSLPKLEVLFNKTLLEQSLLGKESIDSCFEGCCVLPQNCTALPEHFHLSLIALEPTLGELNFASVFGVSDGLFGGDLSDPPVLQGFFAGSHLVLQKIDFLAVP
jgi:hypothetical protein